jgi:hypothetical protein
MAFKDVVFRICKASGSDTRNGFGTTDECLNNFETLASDYCFGQLVDFKGKVYRARSVLKADAVEFTSCSLDIMDGEVNR